MLATPVSDAVVPPAAPPTVSVVASSMPVASMVRAAMPVGAAPASTPAMTFIADEAERDRGSDADRAAVVAADRLLAGGLRGALVVARGR